VLKGELRTVTFSTLETGWTGEGAQRNREEKQKEKDTSARGGEFEGERDWDFEERCRKGREMDDSRDKMGPKGVRKESEEENHTNGLGEILLRRSESCKKTKREGRGGSGWTLKKPLS